MQKQSNPTETLSTTCARFGCTREQARAQYAANAKNLRAMAERARDLPPGKKYRGFTSAELEERASFFESVAASN